MARPRFAVPRYSHHKASDRAYTHFAGKAHYFGRYGTPESKERYAKFIREHSAAVAVAPVVDPEHQFTVAEVVALFYSHCQTLYPHDPERTGKRPGGELGNIYDSLKPLLKLYAATPADDFGPLAMTAVLEQGILAGWSRRVANRHLSRLKKLFRFGVSREMVKGETAYRLAAVESIRRGRPGVRDNARVLPVSDADFTATLPYMPPTTRAMAQLQRFTGMRSSEICAMRHSDVTTIEGGVWLYKPSHHKSGHHGHELIVRIGPKAQAVLQPLLRAGETGFVFSPRISEDRRRAEKHAARTTPMSCGNVPGEGKGTERRPGERYTSRTYAQAIERAIRKARRAGIEVADWNPHQLRHARATEVRERFGLDGAQASLGHRSPAIAAMYAELSGKAAEKIAAEIG